MGIEDMWLEASLLGMCKEYGRELMRIFAQTVGYSTSAVRPLIQGLYETVLHEHATISYLRLTISLSTF